MNNIIAVVVTYNRLDMLKKCIGRLLAQTSPCDILVIDNASTDGTEMFVSSLVDDRSSGCSAACDDNWLFEAARAHRGIIIYKNTGHNLGGAGGFSYGIEIAVKAGYEYIWVMDDDAFAEYDCLEKLVYAALKIEKFGFLSSAVMWKDNTLCRMNWQRKYPTPKKRSERHLCESDLSNDFVRIQSATFVSSFFPSSVIKKVGLPIKEFFIWCDDIEFTRRITLKYKLPAYVVTSSRITHFINNNEGTNLAADDPERIPRYNYAFRNENYMYRQYGIKGFVYYLIVIAYNTFSVISKAKSHKLVRLKVLYKNLFTGLFFNPVIRFPE